MSTTPPSEPPRPTRKAATPRSQGIDASSTVEGSSGDERSDVVEIQSALARAGFYSGELDGRTGPETTEAIRRFQSENGLAADGSVGPLTRRALFPDASAATSSAATSEAFEARPGGTSDRPARVLPTSTVLFLQASEDTDDVQLIKSAIDGSRRLVIAKSKVGKPMIEEPRVRGEVNVFVPCLSRASLRHAREWLREIGEEQLARPIWRVAPLLLEPVSLDGTGFETFELLGRGVPAREASDPDAWRRSVAAEILGLRSLEPRGYLPRFSADNLEGHDLLERRDKLEFLASVLSARELETPIAIGLFGDWGSGKSFFMRRLQERIVELTEASATAIDAGNPSLYCSHVRHVSFNAWLHSGGEIWPAFAAQVFREVAAERTEADQGETQKQDLLDFQTALRKDEERQRTQAERKERIRELEQRRDDKRSQREGLVPEAGTPVGKLAGTFYEIGARVLFLRDGWRELHPSDVLLLLGAIGLAIATYTIFDVSPASVVVGATLVLGLLRLLEGSWRLRREERELDEKLQRERTLEEQSRNAPPSPALLLPEFALKQATDWAQRAQLGTVTQIRLKFDQLSRLLDAGMKARAGGGKPAADAIPIERVIVYVDDLDRCQPSVVVDVLETLKLLVSLPHFVVVVGVAPRWLFRSLELHFRDLLSGGGDAAMAASWEATPQNYLEKIFQCSIVLEPMSKDGFGALVESLLRPVPATVSETRPGTQTVVEPTQDGESAGRPGGGEPEELTEPAPAPVVGPERAPIDLTPAELTITAAEVRFIKGLASMFETPRAAKRLANVYRLMRVSTGADKLLLAESYEPALVLLAINIGFPGLAGEMFDRISSSYGTWPDFLKAVDADAERLQTHANELSGHLDVETSGEFHETVRRAMANAYDHRAFAQALSRVSPDDLRDRRLESFKPWIRVVGEFSFNPWQELLPAGTRS